jgi:glutamine amidotransferase
MLALVDYGAGNLTSVKKAFAAIGAPVFVPGHPDALRQASGVVVPGVGHFAATRALAGGWTEAICELLGDGRPLLGICLGMQWLFEGSDEEPDLPGLGVLGGRIRRLSGAVKVPHVGWNALVRQRDASILDEVPPGAQVYFTHAYAAPIVAETVAVTEHGAAFSSAVERGQVSGVQFHPEKSGDVGLQVLRNFAARAR